MTPVSIERDLVKPSTLLHTNRTKPHGIEPNINQRSASNWNRKDILCLLLVTIVGGILRVWSLATPGGFILDEFYASDACLYVGGSPTVCRVDQEITSVHPPLGKWLIGSGIFLLGFRPAGWRIASVVAGTLTIFAVYLLARRLLDSTLGAMIASGLLAFDFLHFVFSRIAMLDIFLTLFIVLAFVFALHDREQSFGPRNNETDGWVRRLCWRMLAGAAAGAACATKWSGWPVLAALLALTASWEYRRSKTAGETAKIRQVMASLFLCFILLPAMIYGAAYAGRLDGTLLTWPWAENSWLRELIERQLTMLSFHLELSGSHPYTSPAWSWLLLKRPVLMYWREKGPGTYQEILGLGSPLVWWTAAGALLYLAFDWFRTRQQSHSAASIILVGFLACYAPWLVLGSGRQQVFLYYLLPAVPFMCLALGAVAAKVKNLRGRALVGLFASSSIALFVYYYPLLSGRPLSHSSWEARLLFRDCAPALSASSSTSKPEHALSAWENDSDPQRSQVTSLSPQIRPGPSPTGWCWS
jgi:dolichyl-phosphate-mannose--protein O-mannosyl transferase